MASNVELRNTLFCLQIDGFPEETTISEVYMNPHLVPHSDPGFFFNLSAFSDWSRALFLAGSAKMLVSLD